MKHFILAVAFIFIGLTARAQTEVSKDCDANCVEETRHEALRDWMKIKEKVGGWPDQPEFQTNSKSEKDFLRNFGAKLLKSKNDLGHEFVRATGSGNGGDPLAAQFVNTARFRMTECGIETLLSKKDFSKLNVLFYKTKVLSVPFNLCRDADEGCDFKTSFAAKNYPELRLILVNAVKWNLMNEEERMQVAAHEFLGIIGAEAGSYGYSSRMRLVESVSYDQHGYRHGVKRCEVSH